MEKTWFYEILFFQMIIVMVKDKKDALCFMHYRDYITWTRVKLPIVFEEFDMVYIFCSFFLRSWSIGKRSIIAKIWRAAGQPLHTHTHIHTIASVIQISFALL